LDDGNAFVRRAAADALGRHPRKGQVQPLLAQWKRTSEKDTHLVHQIRVSLRDHMRKPEIAKAMTQRDWTADQRKRLAGCALAAPNPQAAEFVLGYLRNSSAAGAELRRYVQFVAEHLPAGRVEALAKFMRDREESPLDFQLSVLAALQQGLAAKDAEPGPVLQAWARQTVAAVLDRTKESVWRYEPSDAKPDSPNPWRLGERPHKDGGEVRLLSTFPRNEAFTGRLVSKSFAIPEQLQFAMAGHNGPLDGPDTKQNCIRLRHAETDQILAESLPPRNDTAQPYTWDLSDHAGEKGYIELVDASPDPTYAWFGVGRFKPAVVTVPEVAPAVQQRHQQRAFELIAAFGLDDFTAPLIARLSDTRIARSLRLQAADTLIELNPDSAIGPLAEWLSDADVPRPLRVAAVQRLGQIGSQAAIDQLVRNLKTAPSQLAREIAGALAGTPDGSRALLKAVDAGQASPRLLSNPGVVEPMRQHELANLQSRLDELTAGVMPANERRQKLIDKRTEQLQQASPDIAHGRQVYQQHCAVCHQVDGMGKQVGPELAGIGNRGPRRLLEDILDPNRNIDAAFRLTTFRLTDGRTLAGMSSPTDGPTVEIVTPAGEVHRVQKNKIESRNETKMSLMPPTFGQALSKQELLDLLGFLLEQDGEQNGGD
jgi:putative heme-binding domain-containing protein